MGKIFEVVYPENLKTSIVHQNPVFSKNDYLLQTCQHRAAVQASRKVFPWCAPITPI